MGFVVGKNKLADLVLAANVHFYGPNIFRENALVHLAFHAEAKENVRKAERFKVKL